MRPLRFATLLVLAGALSGCFQTKTLITLNADGSGVVEETVLMNSTMATTVMMGAAGLFEPNGDEADLPDGPYDEDALRARAEKMGASFAGVETVRVLFGAGYTARYAFDDINDLQLLSDPEDIIPSDLGQGLFGNSDPFNEEEVYDDEPMYDDGTDPKKTPEASGEIAMDDPLSGDEDGAEMEATPPITFTYRDGRLTVHLPQPDAAEASGETAEDEMEGEMGGGPSLQEFRQMGLVLRDMRFALSIEMPGEITETTATHASGRTLTLYDMDFGLVFASPEGYEAFSSLGMGEPDLSRAGMAQLGTIPGFLFESQREVTATFAE